jgi:hypothetical protein
LWDGTFSLARTIHPTPEDAHTYQRFVDVALHGSKILQCPIMPKVHIMLRHVAWQMIHIRGGWVIKWRTGWSVCISGGYSSAGTSILCRTPSFMQRHERRQLLVAIIPLCLLKLM